MMLVLKLMSCVMEKSKLCIANLEKDGQKMKNNAHIPGHQ